MPKRMGNGRIAGKRDGGTACQSVWEMDEQQVSGTGVRMPKRMGNGRIAGKRDRGPARKASTFNLFELGDPLCDRPEVGCGGALLWSVAELRLVGFGGVPFGPPWGWTPKPPQSS